MHELHTAIYSPLLPPVLCNLCIKPPKNKIRKYARCFRSLGIDTKGALVEGTNPDCVVKWPHCPHYYRELRYFGQDIAAINSIAEWSYETDKHKSEFMGSGGQRIIREWYRTREHAAKLLDKRREEERRSK